MTNREKQTFYVVKFEEIDIIHKNCFGYKETYSRIYKTRYEAERAKEDLLDFFQYTCQFKISIVEVEG